jgi:protein-S-isoprenylcysteine O-methyltransferase Ste14
MLPDLVSSRFLVLNVTGILLLISVFVKFVAYSRTPAVRRHCHPVSTLTMTAVLVVMFPILVHRIGAVSISRLEEVAFFILGGILMFLAVGLHIAAKVAIGSYWSDQIETADGQAFVSRGAYSLTRHPMYSSLIFWMLGAAIMYVNPLVAGLVAVVFVPMMIARAAAEEKLLEKSVADKAGYDIYRQRTNFLIPRFGGLTALVFRVFSIFVYGFFIWQFSDGNFTFAGFIFLVVLHLLLAFTILPEKAAFSYKSKTGMMIIVWSATFLFHPIYYLHWFFLFMYVYGLFFNCPCMFVYEKYHGCPCFNFLKRSCKIRS